MNSYAYILWRKRWEYDGVTRYVGKNGWTVDRCNARRFASKEEAREVARRYLWTRIARVRA